MAPLALSHVTLALVVLIVSVVSVALSASLPQTTHLVSSSAAAEEEQVQTAESLRALMESQESQDVVGSASGLPAKAVYRYIQELVEPMAAEVIAGQVQRFTTGSGASGEPGRGGVVTGWSEGLGGRKLDLADPGLRLYWPLHDMDYCVGEKHFLKALTCHIREALFLQRVLVLRSTVCLEGAHNGGKYEIKPIEAYYDLAALGRIVPWVFEYEVEQALGARRHTRPPYLSIPGTSAFIDLPGAQSGSPKLAYRMFGAEVLTSELAKHASTEVVVRNLHMGWLYSGVNVCFLPASPLKLGRVLLTPASEIEKISDAIVAGIGGPYVSLHVRRGDKLNPMRWPNLDRDTQPEAILKTLSMKINDHSRLYISSDERPEFFNKIRLSNKYEVAMLDDFSHLWGEGSTWYNWACSMFGAPLAFDSKMRAMVDYRVFALGTYKLETFNDLTLDPR